MAAGNSNLGKMNRLRLQLRKEHRVHGGIGVPMARAAIRVETGTLVRSSHVPEKAEFRNSVRRINDKALNHLSESVAKSLNVRN
jgi:hypothetical protein